MLTSFCSTSFVRWNQMEIEYKKVPRDSSWHERRLMELVIRRSVCSLDREESNLTSKKNILIEIIAKTNIFVARKKSTSHAVVSPLLQLSLTVCRRRVKCREDRLKYQLETISRRSVPLISSGNKSNYFSIDVYRSFPRVRRDLPLLSLLFVVAEVQERNGCRAGTTGGNGVLRCLERTWAGFDMVSVPSDYSMRSISRLSLLAALFLNDDMHKFSFSLCFVVSLSSTLISKH